MAHLQDLQTLLLTIRQFETGQNVVGFDLERLEATCKRVLACDPFQPIVFEMERWIEHGRELLALED